MYCGYHKFLFPTKEICKEVSCNAHPRVRNLKASLNRVLKELTLLHQKSREMEEIKTNFFASISHELRTPLTLILGLTGKILAQENDIAYQIETPPILIPQIDPEKFQQVLLNLLSNAFKFTPGGGNSIRCALRADDRQGRLDVGVRCLEDSTGEHCLSLCHENLPDMIILDMGLPKINGLGLLRMIRRDDRLKKIPVIVCSA